VSGAWHTHTHTHEVCFESCAGRGKKEICFVYPKLTKQHFMWLWRNEIRAALYHIIQPYINSISREGGVLKMSMVTVSPLLTIVHLLGQLS